MRINVVGPFKVNAPFATEIALAYGLRQLGHEVFEFDPNVDTPDHLDPLANFTLVFKSAGEHNSYLCNMRHPVVLYQPDDLRFDHIKQMVSMMRNYSPHLITFRDIDRSEPEWQFVETQGFATLSSLPVTADPRVYYPVDVERDVDFCFIGSIGDQQSHWQRHMMVDMLRSRGYKVLFGQTQDMDQMRESISRSKVVLNHASDKSLPFGVGLGYQCRHFEVAMAGGCLLSNSIIGEEIVMRPEEVFLKSFVRFDDERSFLHNAEWLVNSYGAQLMVRKFLREEVMRDHSPEVRARRLVDILGRIG